MVRCKGECLFVKQMEEERMKKSIKLLVMWMMTIMCFVGMSNISLAAEAKIEGPSEIKEGEKLEVTVTVPDANQYRVEGTFSYDVNSFVLETIELKMDNWGVEIEGDKFVAYDESKTNLTSEGSPIITATFSLKSSVKPGDLVKVNVENFKCYDDNGAKIYDMLTHKIVMRSAASNNNALNDLEVKDCILEPEFNSEILEYSIGDVEYELDALEINANAQDYRAVVTIEDNSLKVGENAIKINVQAEDGSVRTYSVSVNRKEKEDEKLSEEKNEESNKNDDKVKQDNESNEEEEGLPVWMIILFVLIGITLGGIIVYFVVSKKK